MKLRTGCELLVANIASTGALVQGAARLLPGTRADVHVVSASEGRILARARVVRSRVMHVTASAVLYESGLAFDNPIDVSSAPVARMPDIPVVVRHDLAVDGDNASIALIAEDDS